MDKGAHLSPCRTWRYILWRIWDPSLPIIMFVGLNPSTADETEDDATIRRCVRFAKDWGYGGIYMVNLFAFRATKPADLKKSLAPVGPSNDWALATYSKDASRTVACWGAHGSFLRRDKAVALILSDLYCLGTTRGGQPKHPLRLRSDTKLREFKEKGK